MSLTIVPTPGGSFLAALALVGGARWFADGLRAVRLHRTLRGLAPRSLEDLPAGLLQASGTVALESPLFGPISGKPCAGFTLEVHGHDRGLVTTVREMRTFRLVADGVTARVLPERARMDLEVVAEREFTRDKPLTEQLAARLAKVPEAGWLRRQDDSLRLVERSLLPGRECHVIGWATHQRPMEAVHPTEVERRDDVARDDGWQRTGTDDLAIPTVASLVRGTAPMDSEPDLWIDEGSPFDMLYISSRRAAPAALAPHPLRMVGAVAGPLLTLAGLLYLASAADHLRANRWTM